MDFPMKVNILGTEYTIEKHTYQEDAEICRLSGYCRYLVPEIVIGDLSTYPDFDDHENKAVMEAMEKSALRHEIIHAFLNESGVGQNTFASGSIPWSQNEEMVDWFAIQSPKILKVFESVGCL